MNKQMTQYFKYVSPKKLTKIK